MTRDETPVDKNGRPVMFGDLLRIWHFRSANRNRKVYMYKFAVLVDDKFEVCKHGKHWYAVNAIDIVVKGVEIAHRCRIEKRKRIEIIDGCAVDTPDDMMCWWERPKRKTTKPSP